MVKIVRGTRHTFPSSSSKARRYTILDAVNGFLHFAGCRVLGGNEALKMQWSFRIRGSKAVWRLAPFAVGWSEWFRQGREARSFGGRKGRPISPVLRAKSS